MPCRGDLYCPRAPVVPSKKVFGVGLEGPNMSKDLLRRYGWSPRVGTDRTGFLALTSV